MFEILGVILCVGQLTAPDPQVCVIADDAWGPYATREECLARKEEITLTWPPLYSDLNSGEPVTMFMPRDACQGPGEEV